MNAIGEVGVLSIRTHIGEGEYCDGFATDSRFNRVGAEIEELTFQRFDWFFMWDGMFQ